MVSKGISRDAIVTGGGKSVALKISVYNGETVLMEDATPHITCNAETLIDETSQEYTPKDIPVGETQNFIGLIKVGNLGKGMYLCQMSVMYGDDGESSFKKEFTVQLQ